MAILAFALTNTACQLAWGDEHELKQKLAPLTLGQTHAAVLISLIKKFVPARPTVIATLTGPGSFTSIRIQLATAIGLKIGYQAELFCPSTLDLLEASFTDAIPAIDSLRGDYFTKIDGKVECLTPEEIANLEKKGKTFCGDLGNVNLNIAELLVKYYYRHQSPQDLCRPEPYYVRTPDYKTRANYPG